MPDGTKGLVGVCRKCGFERRFTPEGRPFNHKERRRASRVATGLDAFLNQTSNLNSYDKGLKFEQFCQTLLEAMGYEVEHSGKSRDRGVDLRAVRQEPIGSQTLIIQCKHQASVSQEVVRGTLGMATADGSNAVAVVITTGSFTSDAKKFAQENSAIQTIDGSKLSELAKIYLKGLHLHCP